MIRIKIKNPEIGVCGLSCVLCPSFNTDAESRCLGCKSAGRMAAGCPFITCAVKKRGIEFCRDCEESGSCEKWKKHREAGRKRDSFKCYQTLERDIAFMNKHGLAAFKKTQKIRAHLLKKMLKGWNDGRSKSYYCIAATVMETGELEKALDDAEKHPKSPDPKERAKLLHSILDEIAARKKYLLKLRK